MTTTRLRRSVLYMPGSNPRALAKAEALPADALILDLEDAVTPAEKPQARELVAEAVRGGRLAPREVAIRVNGRDTPWGEADLAAAARAGPDAILIPKVESAAELVEISAEIDAAGAPPQTQLWAMIETPKGVLNAAEIATAPRLTTFILGTNDLVNELRAEHTPDRMPVAASLGLAVLAARGAGLSIIDGVYNAFRDEAGLRAQCEQGKAWGMDGKTLIHPAQIAVTNEVFAPQPDEIAQARRYVAAFEEARAAGSGVAVVDGRIVENLHVANAERLLELAEAIAARQG
ncbi:MAG: CoA ester lyase [Pseudomonadota bacterium]